MYTGSRAIVVGVMTSLHSGRSRLPSLQGQETFLLFESPDRFWDPSSLLRSIRLPLLGMKQSEWETDHSLPSSVEVKNKWSYTPTHMCLNGVHRDSFIFCLYKTLASEGLTDMDLQIQDAPSIVSVSTAAILHRILPVNASANLLIDSPYKLKLTCVLRNVSLKKWANWGITNRTNKMRIRWPSVMSLKRDAILTNSASGSLSELHCIPKAHVAITSSVNRSKNCFISISMHFPSAVVFLLPDWHKQS